MTSKIYKQESVEKIFEWFKEARRENRRLVEENASLAEKIKQMEAKTNDIQETQIEDIKLSKVLGPKKVAVECVGASKRQILDDEDDWEYKTRYVVDEMGVPFFECNDDWYDLY